MSQEKLDVSRTLQNPKLDSLWFTEDTMALNDSFVFLVLNAGVFQDVHRPSCLKDGFGSPIPVFPIPFVLSFTVYCFSVTK